MISPATDPLSLAVARAERACVRAGDPHAAATIWIDGGRIHAVHNDGASERIAARLAALGDGSPGAQLDAARAEARYAFAAALSHPETVSITDEPEPAEAITVSIDAGQLLAETALFLEEARRAQTVARGTSVPVATGPAPPDAGLTAEECAVLDRCDGATSLAEIADQCGLCPAEVSIIATRLAAVGLVTLDDAAEAARALLAEIDLIGSAGGSAVPDGFDDLPGTLLPPAPHPAPDAFGAAPPAAGSPAAASVDTLSLLRELSSIGRGGTVAKK